MYLIDTIVLQPATFCHVIIITGIWVYIFTKQIDVTKIAYQYNRCINHHEYWRVVSASYSHVALLHLAFNMFSLWTFGSVEAVVGVLQYCKYSFLLMVFSMAVITLTTYIVSTRFNRPLMQETYSLGYSCVVFGWMTISAATTKTPVFGLPPLLFPIMSLIFTQVLIPNASFVGHLSGIVVGFLIAFDVFAWVTDYLFFSGLFWTICAFVWSLKTTSSLSLPCLDVPNNVDTGVEIATTRPRMVNGSIVYDNTSRV